MNGTRRRSTRPGGRLYFGFSAKEPACEPGEALPARFLSRPQPHGRYFVRETAERDAKDGFYHGEGLTAHIGQVGVAKARLHCRAFPLLLRARYFLSGDRSPGLRTDSKWHLRASRVRVPRAGSLLGKSLGGSFPALSRSFRPLSGSIGQHSGSLWHVDSPRQEETLWTLLLQRL